MKSVQSLVRAWLARWQALPPGQRRRNLLAGGFLLAVGVLLFHAFVTAPALSKAEGDLSRVKGRAGKAGKQSAPPPVPRLSGKTPGALAKEVKGLEAGMATQRARLDELEPRFVSLDSLEEQQQLRLALTALANRADIELLSLEQKGIRKEEQGLAPTPERQRALAEANLYKRPLMRFQARASYRGLMQFLDGLAELPYVVSPVWLSVEVKTDAQNGQPPRRQWLEVAMDLAL